MPAVYSKRHHRRQPRLDYKMRVARALFESQKYPERFPEFNRFMAFCDANKVRMSFYVETPYIGIRVFNSNDEVIARYRPYTIYYYTMDKKVYLMDCDNWDEGMGMLNEALGLAEQKNDEELISSLGSTIL